MSPTSPAPCSLCETGRGREYPFCPECGKLSPAFVSGGNFAVELEEVPSERIRSDVVSVLKSWFPTIDVLNASKQLSSGRTVVLRGIDEQSAQRLLAAFKTMKAPGILSRDRAQEGWLKRLWNPGLAISAAALLLALIVGGMSGIVLALFGIAVTPVWALTKGRMKSPLVSVTPVLPGESLVRLSSEYSRVVVGLSEQDRETLKSLTTDVFDMQQRLQSDSLAAVAAGAEDGQLYSTLFDSLRTAVEIGARMLSAGESEQTAIRQEFQELKTQVEKTRQWFRSVEGEGIKEPQALSEELREITAGIDRILENIHSPLDEHVHSQEKTRI